MSSVRNAASNRTSAAVEVHAVEIAFGAREVLRGASFVLARGRIGCVLGPSACGKTTLLRALAGFESIQGGVIRIDGELASDADHTVPPEGRRIGMVFQDYALFPHLTVIDNVAFGLHRLPRPERVARAHAMLQAVGLSSEAPKYPHELSGGQQQRVALARALAPEPRLLLLDEPFSNLDIELRERLALEVRDVIKRAGITAVLVTHDQHEAFAIADEIGIMADGAIQQWDSAYNLYHRPATRFIADFVGQGVFVPGRVAGPNKIEIELGTLQAAEILTKSAPHSGTMVDVLLRPDDVVHDDASSLRAPVVSKAFRGSTFLYTLRLASGAPILVSVSSHHNHAIGEMLGIRLAVDHVVAFPQIPTVARKS
ncbi:MAG: ABC transporter ATP-binding protein [Burkholderiales bacterium]